MNKENKDPLAHLALMRDALAKIASFVKDMDLKGFLSDSKTQSAVIMQFQVIGELAKKITDLVKKEIDIPWKDITGLRDMVSHDYFSLDLPILWYTAEQ